MGCDQAAVHEAKKHAQFQFTHPAWGATRTHNCCSVRLAVVSIHAPRVGCDYLFTSILALTRCFNSRTPRGVRQEFEGTMLEDELFQFTHPAWGATLAINRACPVSTCFNSRTPRGVRLIMARQAAVREAFQFTHPAWGATVVAVTKPIYRLFQFTHPAWGATLARTNTNNVIPCFNSRTPRGVRRKYTRKTCSR